MAKSSPTPSPKGPQARNSHLSPKLSAMILDGKVLAVTDCQPSTPFSDSKRSGSWWRRSGSKLRRTIEGGMSIRAIVKWRHTWHAQPESGFINERSGAAQLLDDLRVPFRPIHCSPCIFRSSFGWRQTHSYTGFPHDRAVAAEFLGDLNVLLGPIDRQPHLSAGCVRESIMQRLHVLGSPEQHNMRWILPKTAKAE